MGVVAQPLGAVAGGVVADLAVLQALGVRSDWSGVWTGGHNAPGAG